MTATFAEDDEEPIVDGDPIFDEENPEISLDDVEELEEEENTGHRVTTFDASNDGESYFDGAYFDE